MAPGDPCDETGPQGDIGVEVKGSQHGDDAGAEAKHELHGCLLIRVQGLIQFAVELLHSF